MKIIKKLYKSIALFGTCLLLFFLAACNRDNVLVKVTGYNALRNSVVVLIEVDEDTDEFDALTITIYEKSNKSNTSTQNCSVSDFEEQIITFNNLTSETKYVVTAKYTINKVSKEIFRKDVTTSTAGASEATAKEISTPDAFINELKTDTSGYFKIMADLDFANTAFSMLFTSSKPFTGYIDGNGYTLKNITYTEANAVSYIGIFAYNKGTIKNIKLDNIKFNVQRKTDLYTGIIAGYNEGRIDDVLITNSEVVAAEKSTGSGIFYIGLGIGHNSANGYLKNVDAKGSLNVSVNTKSFIGGLIGLETSLDSGRAIENCDVNVDITYHVISAITSATEIETFVGGFVGLMRWNTIINCTVEGSIAAKYNSKSAVLLEKFSAHVGGFAGQMVGCNLTNVTMTNKIIVESFKEEADVELAYLKKAYVGTFAGISESCTFSNVVSRVAEVKVKVMDTCEVNGDVAQLGYFGKNTTSQTGEITNDSIIPDYDLEKVETPEEGQEG